MTDSLIPSELEFSTAIQGVFPSLDANQVQKAAQFAVLLHLENQNQNLTRFLGVEAFVDGHLRDVIELLSSKGLGSRVLDLGSGCGVPGLLAAAIDLDHSRKFLLVESESNKAMFLAETAEKMGLKNVQVCPVRVEAVIQTLNPDTVIARAVGTVEKISGWIWNCSTWNNLILFKSRSWEEEWKASQLSKFGRKLTITQSHEYSSADEKFRILVTLKRK